LKILFEGVAESSSGVCGKITENLEWVHFQRCFNKSKKATALLPAPIIGVRNKLLLSKSQ